MLGPCVRGALELRELQSIRGAWQQMAAGAAPRVWGCWRGWKTREVGWDWSSSRS